MASTDRKPEFHTVMLETVEKITTDTQTRLSVLWEQLRKLEADLAKKVL